MSQVIEASLKDRVSIEGIRNASKAISGLAYKTPLMENHNLSNQFKAFVQLKREDLQLVRSYKIRGAANKLKSLSDQDLEKGVVCASAGNHAQGVAHSCARLKIHGVIFMPSTTPNQKVEQVKMFGKKYVEVRLLGDTFDHAKMLALEYSDKMKMPFIHPFDDQKVIEGQGTVALEILEDSEELIDYLFVPIGGGGLAAGLGTVFQNLSPNTKIIGVEPEGAAAMCQSLKLKSPVTLNNIDPFVDGAAVKRVGDLNFSICKETLDRVLKVQEGKVCSTILQLYNREAIVVEPAGAMSIAALDQMRDEIKGKNVVCIVSGSNNDITRTEEIRERSLLYEGKKHYFIISFAQRAGALKEFVNRVLGPDDDITHFEYNKKNNRERGPALVGIELKRKSDFNSLKLKMEEFNIEHEYLNENKELFSYIL